MILRKAFLALLFLVSACATTATRPLVVQDAAGYSRAVAADPGNVLVDLRRVLSSARFDIRYATANNFLHRTLYPDAGAYLRKPAAAALIAAEEDFRRRGLGLIIFDGYRPYRITREMWDAIHDDRFVADPAKGSRHNRGCAIDLSLYDLKTGRTLEMPTPYDDFTTRAAADAPDVTATAAANRAVLRRVMESHGFQVLPSEWWHFDFGDWKKFALLNVPFDSLRAPASLKEH